MYVKINFFSYRRRMQLQVQVKSQHCYQFSPVSKGSVTWTKTETESETKFFYVLYVNDTLGNIHTAAM